MNTIEKLQGHCDSEAERAAINIFQDMILTIRWMKKLQRTNQKYSRICKSNP